MPDKIRGFMLLIHLSLGFGAAVVVLQVGRLGDAGQARYIIVMQLALMIALAVLSRLIAHYGLNWARWVCAMLWCVLLPFLMLALLPTLGRDPLTGGLLAAELLTQAGAVGLLFTGDAADWFGA